MDEKVRVGIDIGSETIKAVLLEGKAKPQVIEIDGQAIRKILGQPLRRVRELFEALIGQGLTDVIVGVTGAGAEKISELVGANEVYETNAIATAVGKCYHDVRTVLEMGRESQKYILLERKSSRKMLVAESNLGNKCASGSGSFIDHMAKRLNYGTIQEFAKVALDAEPASLSGRCAVFTESDIVHLYQKGTPRERIAAGVHQAIARNYRSAIARGKEFRDKIAFIGGVSENPAALKHLSEELGLGGRLFVPEHNRTLGAIGAAMRAESTIDLRDAIARLEDQLAKPIEYHGCEPIRLQDAGCGGCGSQGAGVEFFSDPLAKMEYSGSADAAVSSFVRTDPATTSDSQLPTRRSQFERAGLGVDIGSVSTKAALVTEIDGKLVVLASYYRRTDGDPLSAVRDTLSKIHDQIREQDLEIGAIVAATTGSGRYLTGDYIGADLIKNEITAQASGALSYADDIDSIFEIGGQDSKYVRLDGETIIDFEMNKACAAGTGAFLEKQAERLGIPLEEFGDVALRNTRPPDLDWTCTVFSESAMVYYQQNNVPVEDLAAGICLASVKNYLNKNVGSRDIGNKVAFQGAVAFNRGMVAAYETVLGREIVVPPYPHITGAVGAARLAFQANLPQSSFRGFEKIAESKYEVTSFECRSCPNRCDVNTFQLDGSPKYFYNDRCEKFSGAHKKGLGAHLSDLFAEREAMLMEAYPLVSRPGAKKIGIPRGLMFSEYYPLYAAFFGELGLEVVPSDPTNSQIIQQGLDVVVGEPCFPFKVAHGHYINLIEKGVDVIFAPGIFSTEQPNPKLTHAQTCPYLQAAPEVIEAAVKLADRDIQHLSPKLHFQLGERHLRRQFTNVAKELGKSAHEAKKAFDKALATQRNFHSRIEERGREVLEGLSEGQMAFVVIGRPYTLWDPAVNMSIGKKIQDLGILAIPQDFLPLDDEDITDIWSGTYARQIQKKLAAARVIRKDVRLKAVVLTYFACGHDAFANPFFKDELNEPCYVMQIDEHTADAGVITRIEAFADTVRKAKEAEPEPIRTSEIGIGDLNGRKLWVPYANEGARVLTEVMRSYGVNAEVLPISPDPGMNLARKAIAEDVCLPALVTTEDMLYRVHQPDFDPKAEAFFQGNSNGPCRFGMYSILQKRILDRLGHTDTDIVTLGIKSAHGGLGLTFAYAAWIGFVSHDLLSKMMLRVRPYEVVDGQAEALFERYLGELLELIPPLSKRLQKRGWRGVFDREQNLTPFVELLHRARVEFADIQTRGEKRPKVGVIGEFFVRLHDRANQNIVKKLESEGAEVWLAPMTEFFGYANYIGMVLSRERIREAGFSLREAKELLSRSFNDTLAGQAEHILYEATTPFLKDYRDIGPDEVVKLGRGYVDHNFGGEAICSMGKSVDFAKRNLDGIVSVIPFNCMPGNVVAALSQKFRREHDNLPFLNLDYDGFVDASRSAKIIDFMTQVDERFALKSPSRGEIVLSH